MAASVETGVRLCHAAKLRMRLAGQEAAIVIIEGTTLGNSTRDRGHSGEVVAGIVSVLGRDGRSGAVGWLGDTRQSSVAIVRFRDGVRGWRRRTKIVVRRSGRFPVTGVALIHAATVRQRRRERPTEIVIRVDSQIRWVELRLEVTRRPIERLRGAADPARS